VIAEIVCVGTEMLLGTLVDSNSALLGRGLADLGIDLYFKSVVGDNPGRVTQALRLALSRSDLVLVSGGLGPTVDDVTRPALAEISGRPLKESPAELARLEAFFQARNRPMTPNNRVQALVPEGAEAIPNERGTAPGLWLPCEGGKVLVALPGPPSELGPLFEKEVLPRLAKLAGGPSTLAVKRIFLYGPGESSADQAIRKIFEESRNPSVAMLAHGTHIEVRLTAKAEDRKAAEALIRPVRDQVMAKLGDFIFSEEGERLESVVGALLRKKKASLALAESCTGGLMASRITSVPGSSAYFQVGLVTYADDVKQKLLGVPPAVLKHAGAVSKDCALSMAVGLARIQGKDYNLAATGIAGPSGGSADKPVGLVHLALAGPEGVVHQEFRFGPSPREAIQSRAAQAGLFLLYATLVGRKLPEKGEDRASLNF
jgi:nicotinamide-nucleotide amidase